MTRQTRAVIASAGVVAAGVVPGVLIGSLSPLIGRDFEFGSTEVGITVAGFYLVCAIASTPAGRLAQRIGADQTIAYAVFVTAASCIGVAFLAGSTESLIALLLLAGLGDALAGPACSLAVQRELPEEQHGVGFGALQAGAPLGALMAGLALPAIGIPLGWRWAFVAAGAVAIVAGLIMPRAEVTAGASRTGEKADSVDSGQVRAVRLLALAAALGSAAGVSLVSFVVLQAIAQGISESAAGLLLAGISLLAGTMRVLAGALADRRVGGPLPVGVASLALGSIGYVLLAGGEPALIVAGALVGGLGWSWPGVLTLACAQTAPEAAGWAVGRMMSGLFAGALVGPLVTGLLFGAGLSDLAWLACGAASLVAAGILTLVSDEFPR